MGRMNVSIYMKGDYEEKPQFWAEKNKANSKPNKANFKRDDGFSAYYTRDCHGPSGLAMTFYRKEERYVIGESVANF